MRIHGRDVPVKAEIAQLQCASALADADQLLAWLRGMPQPPSQVYLVHGERNASEELRKGV